MNYIFEAIFVGLYTTIIYIVLSFSFFNFKNIYMLLFLVGFIKHLFGYIFNLHSYYCKYGNACINKTTSNSTEINVVIESLFEGILFIVLGYLLLISSYLQKNKAFMFFCIGLSLHILFELLGIHNIFCRERCK